MNVTWMRPRSSRRGHALDAVLPANEVYRFPAPPALCGLEPKAGWAAPIGDDRCLKCAVAAEA